MLGNPTTHLGSEITEIRENHRKVTRSLRSAENESCGFLVKFDDFVRFAGFPWFRLDVRSLKRKDVETKRFCLQKSASIQRRTGQGKVKKPGPCGEDYKKPGPFGPDGEPWLQVFSLRIFQVTPQIDRNLDRKKSTVRDSVAIGYVRMSWPVKKIYHCFKPSN